MVLVLLWAGCSLPWESSSVMGVISALFPSSLSLKPLVVAHPTVKVYILLGISILLKKCVRKLKR